MFIIIIIIAIFATFAAYIYSYATKNLDYWEKRGVKYVKPLPLIGNMLPTITKSMSMAALVKQLYDRYPNERYMGIFQFTKPVLLLRDPELIKKIGIKNFENFVDHISFITEEADPLWGKNLFSSQGERWRDLRQTLSPVFTSSKMRTMFSLMEENVKQLITYLKEQNQNLIEVELKDFCGRYTNDIIASTAFGIKCDSFKDKNNEFLLMGQELTDFSGLNRFKLLLYGTIPTLVKIFDLKVVSNKVGNFFRSIIKENIALREQKNITRPDLIHLLMLARQGKLKYEEILDLPEGFATVQESEVGKTKKKDQFLTDEDITAQAVVFFFGGFDTTSTLLAFAGHELAVNPLIQKRLKDEIKQTFKESEGKVTYERILAMKYLDMVICETLRRWTQAIWTDRKCTKDFEIEPEREGESPVKLKEGDVCWVPIFGIHWDPKYYPNPETFDPERFSEENKDKIKSGTYLPFGIGPRNCIGSRYALLGAKLLFFYLLLNFDLVPVDKTQNPLKLSKDTPVLLAEKGFHVGLKRTI